jgi:NADPH:quinone reductase-like Zn-dependent oxidoreductase
MKAVVYDRYGPPEVLRLEEVDRPAPADDEVLIKVQAVALTRADCATREANRRSGPLAGLLSRLVFGLFRPKRRILGSEFAGEVEALGPAVTQFAVGDRVFGSTGLRFGAHAELIRVPEGALIAHMPSNLTFEEAAAIPDGGLNALWNLRQAKLGKGQSVLVYGASGAIGTAGVQVARSFGADVTALCSIRHVELVRSLGADRVIDYTTEDFTRNGERYDVIFDAVGKHSFARTKGSLKHGGVYLATDGFRNLVLMLWTSRFGDKKVLFRIPPRYRQEDVVLLAQLIEGGKYQAVLDRTYPLDQVAEASRYVETERKTGNVVLRVGALAHGS